MIDLKFLIELNVILVVLGLVFLLIKNRISVIGGRITLVFLPLLAFAATFFKHSSIGEASTIQVPMFVMNEVEINSTTEASHGYLPDWTMIVLLISLLLLIILIIRSIRVLYQFRNAAPFIADNRIKVIVTDKKSSFSFFNRIHLSAHLGKDEQEVVLEHEILHYKNLHSLDMILMEIYQALFWYNPIFILLKRELVQIHEYEVDQIMYRKHNATYLKHLLAHSLGASVAHLLLTSQFKSKSTLAKRIKKMKNQRVTSRLALVALPVVAITFGLISWTYEAERELTTSSYTPATAYGDIEKEPTYKGGQNAMFEFITKNVKYPEEAKKKDIQGTVYVSFNVEATGKLSDVKILKSAHELLDNEAKRVVTLMPDWEPARKEGKAVKAQMTLPITFKL